MTAVDVEDDDKEKERAPRSTRFKERERDGVSKAIRDERESDIADVLEWIRQQGTDSQFRIQVTRKRPLDWNGKSIAGYLGFIEERVDDLSEYIRDLYGGGMYQLKVQVPNKVGGWQYGKGSTITIAGDPKVAGKSGESLSSSPASSTSAPDSLSDRAISSAEFFAERERERADRLERQMQNRGATDMGLINAIVSPLQAQVVELQKQLLAATTREAPKDPLRDRLLETAVAGESRALQEQQGRYESRIDKMRDDHAAELRMLRQAHVDEMKRLEDRYERAATDASKAHERSLSALEKRSDEAISDLRKAHERELKSLERSTDTQEKTREIAHGSRIDNLSSENKRLQAEVGTLRAELAELRSRKDKSPQDQIKELAGMKESLDVLTGGGGDGADQPWYAKLADVLSNSEMAVSVIEKLGGKPPEPPAQPQQQVQQQLPPVGYLIRRPEGVFQHVGNGQFVPVTPKQIKRLQALAKAKAAQAAAQAQAEQQPQAVEETPADALDAAVAEATSDGGGFDNGLPKAKPNPLPQPIVPQQAVPAQPQRARVNVAPPSAEDVKKAVEMIEAAFANKTAPDMLARAARATMSGQTIEFIRQVGVDRFLAAVSKEKPGSQLCTQAGRTFVRAVASHLFGP